MKKEIRLLCKEEIECRVATINEKGVSLLLFKDARVDQKILDEMFTPFGWKRSHQSIDGNLYCTVEIWDDEKNQWIGKQDVGTVSYSQKEKGQASDSFKRACFNWGIGRELYTAPFIWIPAGKGNIRKQGDKFVVSDSFSVQRISYNDNKEIVTLVIVNSHGAIIFSMGDEDNGKLKNKIQQRVNADQISKLEEELKRTGVDMSAVLARYGIQKIEDMDDHIYKLAMAGLSKSTNKIAA